MIRGFINNIKFNRLSYLLEVIELRDFRSKIKAYNKISKMNLTEEMGLLVLNKIDFIHEENYSDFNITISLISLVFKNYYESYSNKIFELYPKLTFNTKKELLNILSFDDREEVLILYRDIISKYYKELDNIPIGNLSVNKGNYGFLFPELYKTLKLDINKNNVIILLNDFVNAGVVPLEHIKKNKKLIQDNVINILKEGLKYKYKDEFFMKDKDYINLRIYLECAVNLEYYVSNKDTKAYLERLLKRKDNQLKLFVLDNLIRKNKNISKISFTSIAKDNLSRYPLYSFLVFNNKENLMPKKYKNNKSLSESDLAINFSIFNSYSLTPYDFELLEEREVNNLKYYIYKFKTKYNYNEEVNDPATDYILKSTNLDKKLVDNGETTYIGISGGFSVDKDPSIIEKTLKELKVSLYNDDYEKIVNGLLPKENIIQKDDIDKEDVKNKVKKEKEKIKDYQESQEEEYKKTSILRRIFSFNTFLMLVSFVIVLSISVLYLYINNVDVFNIMKNRKDYTNRYTYSAKKLNSKDKDKFREINYNSIFTQGEQDYYVLFFKNKTKSIYYPYIDKFVNNEYIIYYVDLNKDENKRIYENNETGFVVSTDTFLRVTEGEYNFYIIGKKNILKEFEIYIDEIKFKEEEKRIEEEKKKQEEEKQAKQEKLEKSRIHEMVAAPEENENKSIIHEMVEAPGSGNNS